MGLVLAVLPLVVLHADGETRVGDLGRVRACSAKTVRVAMAAALSVELVSVSVARASNYSNACPMLDCRRCTTADHLDF